MRGKKAHAEQGSIPAGFDRYGGYLGLRYDSKCKQLVHVTGQIEIAAEILNLAIYERKSISQITRILRSRGVKGVGGGDIQRSGVSRVLAHAMVYAGVITWDKTTITGKVVEPIITEEEAAMVA